MIRDINEQARAKRLQVDALLGQADEEEVIAVWWNSLAGRAVNALLEKQVVAWEKASCWATLDDETKREQGKALRSKELLEYFSGAEEAAKAHKAEAERLVSLLEAAADQGRIPRV